MKINLGAGDVNYEGYFTIDYNPSVNPDYLLDIEKDRLPFQDSVVDCIIAHHVLEHLGEGFFHCIQEMYRVCKHSAIVDIRVPYPTHESFWADPTHRRPIIPMTLKLFSKKFNEYCRQQKLPASKLGEFYNVDFEILDLKYIPDQKSKQLLQNLSESELESYARQHNNIVSEIYIKLIVIKQ